MDGYNIQFETFLDLSVMFTRMLGYFAVLAALLFLGGALVLIRRKQMHIWLPAYLINKFCSKPKHEGLMHIMFCFVDHYEPKWDNPSNLSLERDRVDRWVSEYPKIFQNIVDADGCLPIHTFFYPEEEYRKEHLEKLELLCKKGFGEIEVHLHHNNDTSKDFRRKLESFAKILHEEHGSLPMHPEIGKPAFGFIHGNWALDNSHPGGLFCGVNNELIVLKETGCYADFTLPSAPDPAQTSTINSIYYALDNPHMPKSHDKGVRVEVGVKPSGDLMIIQGPLSLNWSKKKYGFMPGIENGDVTGLMPPTKYRVDKWIDQHIHVKGKPEWVFVKVHTHGTQERNMDTLLGETTADMYRYLAESYNDGERYAMHFVSSREMYNIIKAAEAGEYGNPNDYRDYILARPEVIGVKR